MMMTNSFVSRVPQDSTCARLQQQLMLLSILSIRLTSSQLIPGFVLDTQLDEAALRDCISEKNQKQILRYLFEPSTFRLVFRQYEQKNGTTFLKPLRCLIQIGTIDAVLRGRYFLPSGKPVNLDKKAIQKSCTSTKCYTSETKFSPNDFPKQPGTKTEILLIDGDCLDAAIWLKEEKKLNACVHNMASTAHPGGGYRRGSSAQEENLHRRSGLFACLEDPYGFDKNRQWSYPLAEFGGLYSPDVFVFRGSERRGYPFLEKPQKISFVSVSAYSNPPVETNEKTGEVQLGRAITQHTIRKMTAICSIALENGHDAIVLSAFGCGAFGNPPLHIARLFREVLQKFEGRFKTVAFAILNDYNAFKEHNPEGNITPFEKVFGVKAVRMESLPPELAEEWAAEAPVVEEVPVKEEKEQGTEETDEDGRII